MSFWIKKLSIEKIVEIGPLRENKLESLDGIPIIEEGILSPEKVSEKIQRSKFGMLSYPVQLLGKSGVFAAYASHGTIPIILNEKKEKNIDVVNGLVDGENYLCSTNTLLNFEEISKNIFNWYRDHNLREFAAQIYSLLKNY